MWGLENLRWPDMDLLTAQMTLPGWVVASAAALLVLFLFIALFRASFTRVVTVVAVLAVSCGAVWAYFDRGRLDERRALEARLTAVNLQALDAGSTLACLTAPLGETTEAACENALFVSPEDVAAGLSYISARLALLAEAAPMIRSDQTLETRFARLRRGLEQDRFGLVANVLTVRDGCSPERCEAFALFRDTERLRANMRDGVFQAAVARHSPNWQPRTARQQTSNAAPPPAVATSPTPLYAPAVASGAASFSQAEPTGATGAGSAAAASGGAAGAPVRPVTPRPAQARTLPPPVQLPSPPPRP